MNIEKNLLDILTLKLNIQDGIFQKTKFSDQEIESKYQKNINSSFFKKEIVSNLIIFLGYMACITYIITAFYKLLPIIIWSICFSISICCMIISGRSTNKKFKFYNSHIQIFLSSFNFTTKALIICLFYNDSENDNFDEILRIIIYDFMATNVYLLTKIEADLKTSIFYFFLNIIIVTFSYLYSNQNRHYYLEGFTSFFVFIIFYCIRKEWDLKLRIIFGEKFKFESFYLYTIDYLNGLNGYTLNIKNNEKIIFNEKIYKLANLNFQELNSKEKNKENIINPSNLDYILNKDEIFSEKIVEVKSYQESEISIVLFLKNLIFYEKYHNTSGNYIN